MHQPSALYNVIAFPGSSSATRCGYYRFLVSYRDVEELLAERDRREL